MRSKDTSALPRLPLLVRKHFFLYIPPPSLPVPPPMYSVAETLVTRTLHRLDSGIRIGQIPKSTPCGSIFSWYE